MKQITLLFIGLTLCFSYTFAQLKHLKMPDPTEGMVDFEILSSNTFIVAEQWNNKIYKTTDGGENWTFKILDTQHPGTTENICFINENIGLFKPQNS